MKKEKTPSVQRLNQKYFWHFNRNANGLGDCGNENRTAPDWKDFQLISEIIVNSDGYRADVQMEWSVSTGHSHFVQIDWRKEKTADTQFSSFRIKTYAKNHAFGPFTDWDWILSHRHDRRHGREWQPRIGIVWKLFNENQIQNVGKTFTVKIVPVNLCHMDQSVSFSVSILNVIATVQLSRSILAVLIHIFPGIQKIWHDSIYNSSSSQGIEGRPDYIIHASCSCTFPYIRRWFQKPIQFEVVVVVFLLDKLRVFVTFSNNLCGAWLMLKKCLCTVLKIQRWSGLFFRYA